MNEIESILADFRHSYHKKYGVALDDEILYLLIRMNELDMSLRNDNRKLEAAIKAMRKEQKPQIAFSSRWDCFIHGLGKGFVPGVLFASAIFALAVYLKPSPPESIAAASQTVKQSRYADSINYLPVKK